MLFNKKYIYTFKIISDNCSDLGLSTDEGIAELSDEEIHKQHKDHQQIFYLEDSLDKAVIEKKGEIEEKQEIEEKVEKRADEVLNVGHTNENNIYSKLNLLVADIQ